MVGFRVLCRGLSLVEQKSILTTQEKGVKYEKIYPIDLRTKIPYLSTEQTGVQSKFIG
ncbi:hypothetical protein MS2017_1335 [Bathymodiolus thermophilus thioautotrophic gill symbiont]|uniref:Uncharacterized protein n=1 Tax=Bathymodiolus thermophilus thioautotrophic gill symbiont TaxID=2360 RepID=A0A3G3IML0_9GAMM|nr:hypothetical protein MS2017_1335 [Bathymodiolus thermophilus thioautotrophic gill symbiont]